MNVRIVPRGQPQRTDLYSGIVRVRSDGQFLTLMEAEGRYRLGPYGAACLPLRDVAEVLLDEEPGDWW